MKRASLLITFACAFCMEICFARTTMVIINNDGNNEGLNDPTPVEPVGGNSGTTLGEQRLIALQYAADLIGLTLHSDIPITISAEFNALGGNEFGGTLGSAGPAGVLESFEGAPINSVWYPASLANKLANQDFSDSAEVEAELNSDVDGPVMLGEDKWYYGLDANPPSGDVDFITVALHELAHGFGFLSLVDISSGQKFSGLDDIYTNFLNRRDAEPAALPSMSNLQRSSAIRATGELYWQGSSLSTLSDLPVEGISQNEIAVYAPDPVEFGSSISHFSTELFPNNLMEPSYDGANHELGLATTVLSDIGWGNLSDLSTEIIAPSEEIISSTPLSYQLVVSNLGGMTSPTTFLRYTPPGNASISSFGTDQGSCQVGAESDNPAMLTCELGEVIADEIVTITMTLQFTTSGEINHTAQVYGDIVEERVSNNIVSRSETVDSESASETANSDTSTESDTDGSSTESNSGGSAINDNSDENSSNGGGTSESGDQSNRNESVNVSEESSGGSFTLFALLISLFVYSIKIRSPQ